jgi:16S rRNA (uracil1498-N3)-methyltransferase
LPLPFNDFVASPEYAASAKFILHEKAPLHLKAAIPAAPVLLCVGPEGGWDAKEIRAAEQAGFQPVSMGSRTMRAETAALAAVAVFQFLLEQPPVE